MLVIAAYVHHREMNALRCSAASSPTATRLTTPKVRICGWPEKRKEPHVATTYRTTQIVPCPRTTRYEMCGDEICFR